MTFPITLIKLITEYVPTPYQLVERELQTKGLMMMTPGFNSDDTYPVGSFGELIGIKRHSHVQMRADLMAFHLSKV